MREGRDRTLLDEWLCSQAGYGVTAVSPGDTLPPEYDLALLDAQGLERNREALVDRVEAVDPVFLPHLLVTPDESAERHLDADSPIDDVVAMPVDQSVLHRRLQNSLQARAASLRLAEREEQYQQLVELTPEILLVVRDGEVVYANTTAADTLTAAEPATLYGPVTDLVGRDDRDRTLAALETIEREGRLDGFRKLTMLSTTGEELLVEVAGVTVTFEGEPAVQLLGRNITEKHERKQQLSLFGKAIETARQGVTIADARQKDEPLVYVNGAFERITGYQTGETLGRNCRFRFLQGPGTDESKVRKIRTAVDDRRPVVVELLNYRKDGTPFWNRLEVVPVRNEEGTVTHFLGLQRDVTQRRQREERLTVLDRVLRHNIRNRMNVIRSRAELLREEYGDDSVETIIQAADDLIDISGQVREFQSLVSVQDHELGPRDLVHVLEESVADLQGRHPDVTVRLDCPDEAVAEVHATLPAALVQVLEFAVGQDRFLRGAVPDLTVQVTAEEGAVTVAVFDHAGTIPHDDLEAVGRGSETPLQHSRGLELWLIRWAVLTSDGSLSVEECLPPETDRGAGGDAAEPDGKETVGCLRMRFRRAGHE